MDFYQDASSICPGCHNTVDVDSSSDDAVITQRKTWHKECYDKFVVNKTEPMTFCPWCFQGFTPTQKTLVSQNNRRWHRECWQRRRENQDEAIVMNLCKSTVCPGCKTTRPCSDSHTSEESATMWLDAGGCWHLSKGGYWWCDKCWRSSLESGRFQVGTVPMEAIMSLIHSSTS